MKKGLVFSVDIGDEMLTALRKVQNGAEIDDLGAGRAQGGILPGEHLQIMKLFRCIASVGFHAAKPPFESSLKSP